MGWLKKLPRFIRPPKKVRQEIEKIKGGAILKPIIGALPGGGTITGIVEKIKNTASQSGGLVAQAGGAIQDARAAAQSITEQEKTIKTFTTVAMIAIGIAVVWLVFKRR